MRAVALHCGIAAWAVAWPYALDARTQAREAATAPVAAGPNPSSLTAVYDAAFFAQYAPRTALDIVQRIPGFTLDLGANNNNNGSGPVDIRGFAGAAGNVVINGQRPSTKSEPLDAYLGRIPASRVKRVEVGSGDLYGADFTSKSQVANLVLVEGGAGGLSGNATITAERHYTSVVTPTASGSINFIRGASTFNIAGDTAYIDLTEEGTDLVTDPATGELLEFRCMVNTSQCYSSCILPRLLLE